MADIARNHGGDCGGDPPRRGRGRIRSQCESSSTGRGITIGKNLEDVLTKNQMRPLAVEFDRTLARSYKPIGKYGAMMVNLIGTLVRGLIPPYYKKWENVPSERRDLILPRIEFYFDIQTTAPDHDKILASIDRMCADRYSDSKSVYKDYFDDQGGYDNIENARRHPEPRLTSETWNKLIDDIFLDPKWKNQSIKNTANRKKLKYPSFHGTSSYVNARYKRMNRETREVPGIIDNWYRMHYKENRGWANEEARLTYEQLVAERASQSSSSSSVNEQEVAAKVLGVRRGFNVGCGQRLKNTSIRSYFPSSSASTSSQPHPTNEEIQQIVRENVRENNKRQDRKYRRLERWVTRVIETNPNLHLPPIDDVEEDEEEDDEDEETGGD